MSVGEMCEQKHTFESDVYMLPQPGVDTIRGGIFRDRIVLQPTATGESIKVLAGIHGPIHFTQNRPRYKLEGDKKTKTSPTESK